MKPPAGSRRGAVGFDQLLLSCEHAANALPARWAQALGADARWLSSHRGYDPGSAEIARRCARHFGAPLHLARWTRLLCDLNRDPGHPQVLGTAMRRLPTAQRQQILQRYHQPYRKQVEEQLLQLLKTPGRLLHLSLHSFTPRLQGITRPCELGIMYDPARSAEADLARALRQQVQARDPRLRVRLNYPYRGASIYFQPFLRRRLRNRRYLALQLEINQKLPRRQTQRWLRFQQVLFDSLAALGGSARSRQAER